MSILTTFWNTSGFSDTTSETTTARKRRSVEGERTTFTKVAARDLSGARAEGGHDPRYYGHQLSVFPVAFSW